MRIIAADQLATQAGLDGQMLVTQAAGNRYRPVLEAVLTQAGNETVGLHFGAIELMDASFANAVFGTIASTRARRQARWSCLVLQDLNEVSLDNLEMALTSRPQREPGLRNCVALVEVETDRLALVGKLEGHVEQTFEFLRLRKQGTARELSDHLRLDIAAASTRLKVLHDLGLAVRTESRDTQGKQFVYTWPG